MAKLKQAGNTMDTRRELGPRRTEGKRNVKVSGQAGTKIHIRWKRCYLLQEG